MGQDVDHWSRVAGDWIAWAQTPGHDAFWAYRTEFAGFVGAGTGAAVDIGCGEGRQSRLLGELGHDVTACDPVAEMLDAAREAGSARAYARAPATDLPFADDAFGLTLLYNCLMDIADAEAAVVEAARVTAPGGRVVVSIVHPIADLVAEREDWDHGGADYFAARSFDATTQTDGLVMHFSGWARPLSFYTGALCAAGLAITRLAEPRAAAGAEHDRHAHWRRLPLFLWIEARARQG